MMLAENTLHIWHIRHVDMRNVALDDILHLSAHELTRAKRFKKTQHGLWWAFVRQAMRDILSQYLGTGAQDIRFEQQKNAKPKILGTHQIHLEFNLSHTKDYALLAIHPTIPVGVDVEALAELNDMPSVVQGFFSMAEQEQFSRAAISNKPQSFYQIWTRKESFIKANGLGLSAVLQDFDVPVGELPWWKPAVLRADLECLGQHLLLELPLASGFTGAVCLHSGTQENIQLPALRHFTYTQENT